MTKKAFLVYFDNVGYYAQKQQPNCVWAFTEDPYKAFRYGTREGAERRAEKASQTLSYKHLGSHIVKIKYEVMIDIEERYRWEKIKSPSIDDNADADIESSKKLLSMFRKS